MADEWYRTTDWDPGEFETRLRRARATSRPQYLRIKALALMTGGAEARSVAIQLLQRLEDDYPEASLERATTPEWLGDAYRLDRQYDRAADCYVEAVNRQRDANVLGNAPFSLARMVLGERMPDRYAQVLAILREEPFPWLGMNWHLFERASGIARLADRLDQPDLAGSAAEEALHLAATRTSPEFPYHPDVGLIEADDATVAELRRMAGAGDSAREG